MTYDSATFRFGSRLCCAVLSLLAGVASSLAQPAGQLDIINNGPCAATNVYYSAVVVEQSGFSGHYAPSSGGPIGSGVGGGNFALAAGATRTVWSVGITGVQSQRLAVFCAQNGGGLKLVGYALVTGSAGATLGFFPDCGGTNISCITNSLSRSVANNSAMYGIAVFEMDGVLKYSQSLAPGESATYLYEWCRTINEDAPTLHFGMSYNESAIVLSNDGTYEVANNPSEQMHSEVQTNTADRGISGPADTQSFTNAALTGSITNSTAQNLTNAYPINWNNPDTTSARDATLKAGFNKLASQNQSIINGLGMIAQNSGGGGSGGTNISITISNQVGLTSNELWSASSQVTSSVASNAVSMTNYSASGAAALNGNWTNMIAGGLMGFEDGDGPDTESFIALPSQYTGEPQFRIKPSLVTENPIFTLARNLCKWFIVGMTLYAMFCWAEKGVHKLFEQRQVQGNNQLIAGFNVNAPSALAYAAVIATTIAGLPLVLGVFMTGPKDELTALAGIPAAVVATVGWTYATAIIPVGVMISSFITYCTFRFLIGMPLLSIARFILVMLAG